MPGVSDKKARDAKAYHHKNLRNVLQRPAIMLMTILEFQWIRRRVL